MHGVNLYSQPAPRFGGLAQGVRTLGARAAQPLVTASSQSGGSVIFSLLPSILIGSLFLYQKGMQTAQPNSKDQIPARRLLVESGLGYLMATLAPGIVPFLYGLGLTSYRAGQQNNTLDKLHAAVNTAGTLGLGYLGVLLFSGLSDAQRRVENQAISAAWKNPALQAWKTALSQHPDPSVQEFSRTLQALDHKLQAQEQFLKEKTPSSKEKLKVLQEELAELKANAVAQLQSLDDSLIRPTDEASLKAASRFRQALVKSQYLSTKFARATNPLAGYLIMGLMLGPKVAKDVNSFLDKRFPQLRHQNILARGFSQENTLIPREFSFGPILPAATGSSAKPAGAGH
jgi:hypothetical protein